MNREKPDSPRPIAAPQPGDAGDSRKWLTAYNLDSFPTSLGLFSPLLWVSVHSGADRGIILINGFYTVLLAAFGVTVMLTGRRQMTKKMPSNKEHRNGK